MDANGAEGCLIPLEEGLQDLVLNGYTAHVELTESQSTLR